MQVYLIRHAESSDNARGLRVRLSRTAFNTWLQEADVAPLTPRGFEQAQRLVAELSSTSIERIYTSPCTRALTTATILGHARNLEPLILPDLREIMPPALKESENTAPLFQHFLHGYLRLLRPHPSHEWLLTAYQRVGRVWDEITREPANTIAVVSHLAFLRLLLGALRFQDRWRSGPYHLHNGGVTCVWSVK